MGVSYENGVVTFEPGLTDGHGHPRAMDPQTSVSYDPRGLDMREGKAGLPVYAEVALASGITAIVAMPNESYRIIDTSKESGTDLVQFPIATADRAQAMEIAIATQSYIYAAYNYGLDRKAILRNEGQRLDLKRIWKDFDEGGARAAALKMFGDESNGGNNIPVQHFPTIVHEWHKRYPEKPIVMHLEDGNVRRVLSELNEADYGREAPIHVAHVSSREELEAVIWAKEQGMNVTCEVTPHHLFIDETARDLAGNYGCMKPSLKTPEDIAFLWANMKYIDIIASDCAPHKVGDKESSDTVWGVANHTVMMPLLLGAVEADKITLEELYEKMVINPRERFNLPFDDNTISAFQMDRSYVSARNAEREIDPQYGQNIFAKLEELDQEFTLRGVLLYAQSGASRIERNDRGYRKITLATNLGHLIVPK